ncbi:hypothetical protein [Lysobacter sp. Root494]|uniref:hypothetical protein n=1 Tax=Lysobacter sp. Root494 TaxID=1736549 RepID=UPI0012FA2D35|nr:hypothetical protein [Lysobacter sp. Root494]
MDDRRAHFGNRVVLEDMQPIPGLPGGGAPLAMLVACSRRFATMRTTPARIPIGDCRHAIGCATSIRDAVRGRKKFAQFLRKSGCAMPDRAADRRRLVNTGTVADRPAPHHCHAPLRNGTARDAQTLREKNAFI